MSLHHFPTAHGRLAYQWSHHPCVDPLVVLHGLGDSAIHTYAPLFASTVLKNTPALFIDFAGFGEGSADELSTNTIESMSEDVASLLTALNIHAAPIFAHSMGANVALVLAYQHPGLVSNLILGEPLLDQKQSVLATGIAKYSEGEFLERGYNTLLRATSLQARRGEIASVAFLPVLNIANPRSLYWAAISLLEHRDPGYQKILHRIKQPAAILIGGKSPAAYSASQRVGIPLIEIANAGHFMFVEQADSTACAILNLVCGMHYGEKGAC